MKELTKEQGLNIIALMNHEVDGLIGRDALKPCCIELARMVLDYGGQESRYVLREMIYALEDGEPVSFKRKMLLSSILGVNCFDSVGSVAVHVYDLAKGELFSAQYVALRVAEIVGYEKVMTIIEKYHEEKK